MNRRTTLKKHKLDHKIIKLILTKLVEGEKNPELSTIEYSFDT